MMYVYKCIYVYIDMVYLYVCTGEFLCRCLFAESVLLKQVLIYNLEFCFTSFPPISFLFISLVFMLA
uniref:Uncharacterized protein n=1 Tax=Octopus bimaculoides TaxID=37653 RepID=A0A0L8FHG3_OCTBM